ncbi:MAG: hypothetical protein IPI35_00840 [Deltaproteobacteria bacterium]|nr:hypothetical protein [Deltaproteobacteria bacterium]
MRDPDETAFFPSIRCSIVAGWKIVPPTPTTSSGAQSPRSTSPSCHEADPCLTEACIVALDRDFEEAPDDCALVPAACDGIFNLDVDRCAE